MRLQLRSHATAAATLAAAVALRWAIDPWLGGQFPLIFTFAAVALASAIGGWRCTLWVAVAGWLAARWLFIEPRGGFALSLPESGRLLAYVLVASVIAVFGEIMHRMVLRAEHARQLAEQEAARRAEAEARYRLAADAVNGVIYEYDFRTGHVHRTRGLDEVLGWLPEEVPPLPDWWEAQVHPDDRAERQQQFHRAANSGQHRIVMRYRMRHKEGHWLHVEDRAVLVHGEDGSFAKLHGCTVDVSHLKQAEESMRRLNTDLREADRRKDEFFATLAHELRNPLAPIRNVARLLQQRGPSDPQLVWGREIIDRQVAYMTCLLEDLLDVSRMAQGKLELQPSLVLLSSVLDAAVQASRAAIEAAGHRLKVSLPDMPLQLQADAERLAQVFAKLLTNAAQYTERGGLIELSGRREGFQAVVTVRDTGIGIAPEMLGRLFETFSHAQPGAQRAQGGLGIGLSLVKGLVELHGGRVTAKSDGPQRGSEFTVQLPLPAAGLPEPGAHEAGATLVRLSRRVLVVDDNRDSADTLSTLLRVMGCEVQAAYDGLQALECGAHFRPDAVLLDLGMPKLNGFETCERMRREKWGRPICIVALTGWGQEEDRRRTKECGFDAHLVKPVDPGKLTELLASISVKQPREVM